MSNEGFDACGAIGDGSSLEHFGEGLVEGCWADGIDRLIVYGGGFNKSVRYDVLCMSTLVGGLFGSAGRCWWGGEVASVADVAGSRGRSNGCSESSVDFEKVLLPRVSPVFVGMVEEDFVGNGANSSDVGGDGVCHGECIKRFSSHVGDVEHDRVVAVQGETAVEMV